MDREGCRQRGAGDTDHGAATIAAAPNIDRRRFLQSASIVAVALGQEGVSFARDGGAPRTWSGGEAAENLLPRLARSGMESRFAAMGARGQEVSRHSYGVRLEAELAVIRERGLTQAFLTTRDIVRFARARGIAVSPGRGAAPSSLVAYSLGITGVDPVAHRLLFERFINPVPTRPSVCLDFCARRLGEVIEFVSARYGRAAVVAGDAVVFDQLELELSGLVTLTDMQDSTAVINQQRRARLQRRFDLEAVPLDDPAVYQLLASGDGEALFHREPSPFRNLLRRLGPDRFEDVAAAIALCRPGPFSSGMVDDFIDRRRGGGAVVHEHPLLEPILGDSYGLIVYQEQVMRIAASVAGYSLDDADFFRRALAKRRPEAVTREQERFMSGAIARGIGPSVAGRIFSRIQRFAPYTFNRSHAVACALITYRTAHLKTYHPAAHGPGRPRPHPGAVDGLVSA